MSFLSVGLSGVNVGPLITAGLPSAAAYEVVR